MRRSKSGREIVCDLVSCYREDEVELQNFGPGLVDAPRGVIRCKLVAAALRQ